MLYQVTCKKCGGKFRITVDNVLKTASVCPHCGQKLAILIPKEQVKPKGDIIEAVSENVKKKANNHVRGNGETMRQVPKKKRGKGLKILFIILVVALHGLGFMAFYWYRQNVQETERLERQHHRDSVEQVRKQVAEKVAAEKLQEKRWEKVSNFVKSFYENAVLSGADVTQYEQYLTDNCRRLIYGNDENAYDLDKQTAWWGFFGTLSGLENSEELLRNLRVSHYEDDWYKVRLSQNGETEQRLIRIKQFGGRLLIDNVR